MGNRVGWAGWWGIAGVVLLLGEAIARLVPIARDAFAAGLTPVQAAVATAWIVAAAYTEGWRGFQRQFSPRVVARAQHLAGLRRPWLSLLAPLYCMGLIHATRRRLIGSWALAVGIVVVVLLVRGFDQPWRGIVDGGVVVGLSWGIASIAGFAVQAARGRAMPVAPDLPAAVAVAGAAATAWRSSAPRAVAGSAGSPGIQPAGTDR